jgi:anti-anti-sigma factor
MRGHQPSSSSFIGGGAPLQITSTIESPAATIAVRGELDRETTPRLAAAVEAALEQPVSRIELDMTDVTFMDSQGLRILLEAKRSVGRNELVLVGVNGQVLRLLHATGLEDVLGI